MRSFDKLQLRVRSLWRRDEVEREMSAELQFHLDELIRDNVAAGMSTTEARQAALRTMGGVAQYEEQIRDSRRVHVVETAIADIRYALRALRKAPVFATVAILSLALGTGANAAIFSLIDSVLLQQLPVREPQQLALVRTSFVKVGAFNVSRSLSNATRAHLSDAKQIDGLASVREMDRVYVGVEHGSDIAPAQFVSGTFFSVLGLEAEIGRTLGPSDDRASTSSFPVMISYAYWQRRFGGREDVLGQKITVNTIPFTVVGVMPRRFRGLTIDTVADVTMPLAMAPQVEDGYASGRWPKPEDWSGTLFARIKPGVTFESAQSEMTGLLRQSVAEEKGGLTADDKKLTIVLTPAATGISSLRSRFEKALEVLMGVVALVMLIASANLASLLLTRSAARQREICIRMSLGSSRWRLVRQLLTESMVLSALGGALGLLFAWWARSALVKVAVAQNSSVTPPPLDWNWHLFGFVALLCLLNALVFGTLPALKATRLNANLVLHSGRTIRSASVSRTGKFLVAAQVALSLTLLVGAALLLQTLANFYKVDLGFNQQNVLMMTVDPHLAGYADGEPTMALFREIRRRLAEVPGVKAVSMIREPLLGGSTGLSSVYVPGYVPTPDENASRLWTVNEGVGPHFFATMQMPLVAGRDFGEETLDAYNQVAIINQTMAKHFFPGRNAIGQHVAWSTKDAPMEIIGVAADAHYFGVKEDPQDVIFVPLLHPQMKQNQATLLLRTAGDPARVAPEARAAIRAVNGNLPVYDIVTLPEVVKDKLVQQRVLAVLSGFFGALALVLSAIGLYGILAYNVTQRTGEIGVRMALGATRGKILNLVFGETAQVLGAGIVAGIGLTVGSTRLMQSILYGVEPTDGASMGIAALILAAVALAAALIPMRRAMRVDPMSALRQE